MKRLFTRLLLVTLLTVLGTTLTWAQKSVLDESFGGGSLPKGWSIGNEIYWDFTEGNARLMSFKDATDMLVAPMKSIKALDNEPSVAITYKLAENNSKFNELKVLYRTSTTDGWTEWETLPTSDEPIKWKKAIPNPQNVVQIAIAATYNLGGETRIYRVALENKTEATDAPANFNVEELQTKSAKLVWDAFGGNKFEKYNIKVNSIPLADMSLVGDVADTNSTDEWFELTNLQPDSEYWCYVQYDCGDGDVSPWAEFSFRTPCSAVVAPFSESFEGELSNCYTVIEGGSVSAISSEFAFNSTKSFKSNSAKGKYNYLILPEFSGDVKKFQVSFMAAAIETGNTYSRTVSVGVCANATAESFTEVKTLTLPKGRTWEAITISLKGYAGSGKNIAFKFGNEDAENRLFIDNIKVEMQTECPLPIFLTASAITFNQAQLNWTAAGDETEWNLVLSTTPLSDPLELDPDAEKGEYAGSISEKPYTATNLLANTTYYAYLQAGGSCYNWTNAVQFKTTRAVSFPYVEHFDRMKPDAYTDNTSAIPDNWVMDDRNTLASDNANYDKQNGDSYRPYVTTAQNHEQTAYVNASLLLRGTSSGTGSTKNISSIAILPAMPKAVNKLMLTFWANATYSQTLKVGVAKTQTNDLPKGQQLGANITEVGEFTIAANEWKQYKLLLTNYTGEGSFIAFYMKPGTSTPSVYIDDIEIDEAPNCNAVTGLTGEALSINSAKVSWTDASSSTSWKVKVSSTEIDPSAADGDIANATVNKKEYTATGLTMGGTYYFYVSPTCGDMWEQTSVKTLVGLEVPYYTDFSITSSDYAVGAKANRGPENWIVGSTGSGFTGTLGTQTWIPYVDNTTSSTSGWYYTPADRAIPFLKLYNATTAAQVYPYAIMPQLLNADVKDLKMTFYAYTSNTSTTSSYAAVANKYYNVFKIGVVNSPSDINNADGFSKVTQVAAIRCTKGRTTEYFQVDMSGYTGSGKYIVFYQDSLKTNTSFIDNLSITLASAPQKITDLAVSNITQTGAKLTWTENGKATKWNVKVFEDEPTDIDAETPVFITTVTAKEATITSLKHSTLYYAYAQSSQDNGNSEWVGLSFWTETGNWAVPYEENFSGYAATSSYRSLPNYYGLLQADGTTLPASNVYIYVYNYQGENFLKMQATSSYKVTTFTFPPFEKPVNTLEMTFLAHADAVETSTDAAKQTAIDNSPTEIGILEDDGTFVPVSTFRVNSIDWEEKYVNFQSYTGAGGRIAIRCDYNKRNNTNTVRMDNFLIKEMSECGRLLGVEVSEIDSTSAKLSWIKSKTETKWNLKISTSALSNPAAETADFFDGQLSVQNKNLTGLEGNTNYYVYIQTVDEAKDCVGDWSSATVFRTLCKLQTFPYFEDFESYGTGVGNLPDCSNICGEDADHSYVNTNTTYGKRLYINQKTKEHKNYFVFPALRTDDIRKLQLSMQVWVGTITTSTYRYQIGIMTDPNDPTTFVSLHNEELLGASTPYDRVYTFEDYAGDETGTKFGGYIAISPRDYTTKTNTTGYTSMHIDNVTIDFIETCAKPTDLAADSIGSYGVKLIWKTDNKTAAHRVRLFTSADVDPSSDAFAAEKAVNDTVAVVEGLSANTVYYAFVRKECAANDVSKWSSAYMVKTICAPTQTMPYEEGFESGTSSQAPECWTSLLLSGSTSAKAQITTSSDYVFSGTKAMSVNYYYSSNGSSSTTGKAAAVTPELDIESPKEVLIYFDLKSGSATHNQVSLRVEAVSDETNFADAIYITTIEDITSTWKKAYIKVADYYTSAQPYKRFRFTPQTTATSSGATVYIDNIVFTKDLNVVLPVSNLETRKVDVDSLTFSFLENTPGVNAWKVAYGLAGVAIDEATVFDVATTEVTIKNLTANTSYDIYVRSEQTDWVGPLTATTVQVPTTIPYVTGWEDESENALWNLYNVKTVQGKFYENYFIIGDASKCGAADNKALFVTNDGTNYMSYGTNAQTPDGDLATSSVWATRNIRIATAGTYKFSFKLKQPGNATYDNDAAYVQLLPVGCTFKGDKATLPSGGTRSGSAVSDGSNNGCFVLVGKTREVSDWTWVSRSLDIMEPGIYTIAVFWYNASSPSAAPTAVPLAVDSIVVDEYLCTLPSKFEYTARGAHEASLKWFAGSCTNFEYVVSEYSKLGDPAGIDAEDKVAAGTITDGPKVTITGLDACTNYSLYVRTICPDGYTDWVEHKFLTACEAEMLPYTETFIEKPECWTFTGATMTSATVDTEKWSYAQLNANGIMVLPELNVPITKTNMEIGIFNTTSDLGTVVVGVVDNTWDASTFKEVKAFATKVKGGSGNDWTLEVFSQMFNLYQGTGKLLAIKNIGACTVGVKYVTLTELADCVQPQQVEITYPTETEFTVNWIAGLEDQWEIQLNDSLIKNVTENPYRITGLEQGSVYTVAVRAICDEVHTSEWSASVTIQTPCGANALPLFEDFSGLRASNNRASLTCWNNLVTDSPIEQVFKGNTSPYKPVPNLYYTYMWIANYLSQLGDEHQLLFFGSTLLNGGPKYRWMITPRYAIESNASLSFEVKHVDNKNKAAHPEGRFIVAISTDNGASWKKEDATVIEGIDSVYTTKSVSLNQYIGQDICIAFYMENLGGETTTQGSGLFTLLDNVRINCTDDVEIDAKACEDYDYEQNGFSIKKEELPAVGDTKTFTRFEKAESGCDKNVILNLTVGAKPQIDDVHATICDGDFYDFGGQHYTKPNPEGHPYYIAGETTYGCDSTIYLYLDVNPSDTTNYANPIVKFNDELPFAVDNYFELTADVLPENATTITFDTIVVHDGCHFWRYSVTVNRCTLESEPIEVRICEDKKTYQGYGFDIAEADMPAAGETKDYPKTVRNAHKCDSTATLRLTVVENDTIDIPVELFNNEILTTNYKVDELYTIPYPQQVGSFVKVLPNGSECGYNRYNVTIKQCTREGEVREILCEHQTSYNENNFEIPSDGLTMPIPGGDWKQYTRHDWTADGCDSTTTLYLKVLVNDTTDIPVAIQNTDLMDGDYVVDAYYSVPEATEIGADFFEVVNIPGTCEFNRYHVTVTKCEIPVLFEEQICEGSESYKGYGFDIAQEDMPARLETKTYERHNPNEWGCDSVITLSLKAWNDTTDIYVSKVLTDLPVVIDDYYSIPSDAPIGEQFTEVRQRGDGCEYNRYIVMVSDCASSDIFEDAICSVETSYEGYGFTLAQEELPAAGETKPYYRDEPAGENSCKHITLKLTVIKNDTTDIYVTKLNTELPFTVDDIYTIPAGTAVGSFVEVLPNGQDCKFNRYNVTIEQATKAYSFQDAVCEDVTNYKGYGFDIAPEDMPAPDSYASFGRHGFELDEFGVDSIITLRLTVQANDTTFIVAEVFNNELPYMAGDEVVIPAGVPFGPQDEVVLANAVSCSYTSYKITVNQCVRELAVRDSICEGEESYMGYGFSIPSAEFGNLPEPGKRIEYTRHETTLEGCDSIITLSLKVMKIDTVRFASIDVNITELPYDIDLFFQIPAETPLGEGFAVIPNPEKPCGYRRYAWNITPCTEKYPLQREFICGDADYVAHGFNIPAADLPAVGESKEFTRTNKNEQGCDSIITITLTVNAPDTTNVEKTVLNTDLPYIVDGIEIVPAGAQIGLQPEVIIASTGCVYKRYLVTVKQCTNKFEFLDGICEGENYNGYGFSIAAAELPEAGDSKDYTRTARDEAGCDSVITLTLIVNEIDTVDVIEEVLNTELPYMVGDKVVVPAGAPLGEQPEVILYNGSCIYNRYIITVNPCEESYEFDDDVCAGADYNGYGFSIAADQLPATGGAVDFTRTAKDEAGCDSLITLTLMVSPSEVIALEPLEISVDALPYKLNDYITIPADLEVGVYEGKVQVPGECLFYSYSLTVHESGWGIINVTDDVESIEVYDLLGRMIFTLRQGEEMKQQLPMGVYMLHTIMKSGATVNSKVVLK